MEIGSESAGALKGSVPYQSPAVMVNGLGASKRKLKGSPSADTPRDALHHQPPLTASLASCTDRTTCASAPRFRMAVKNCACSGVAPILIQLLA